MRLQNYMCEAVAFGIKGAKEKHPRMHTTFDVCTDQPPRLKAEGRVSGQLQSILPKLVRMIFKGTFGPFPQHPRTHSFVAKPLSVSHRPQTTFRLNWFISAPWFVSLAPTCRKIAPRWHQKDNLRLWQLRTLSRPGSTCCGCKRASEGELKRCKGLDRNQKGMQNESLNDLTWCWCDIPGDARPSFFDSP